MEKYKDLIKKLQDVANPNIGTIESIRLAREVIKELPTVGNQEGDVAW